MTHLGTFPFSLRYFIFVFGVVLHAIELEDREEDVGG